MAAMSLDIGPGRIWELLSVGRPGERELEAAIGARAADGAPTVPSCARDLPP